MRCLLSHRRGQLVGIAAGTAILILASMVTAFGEPVSEPVLVSGVDQLPDEGQPNHCGSTGAGQEWEQDNTLAVDPGDDDFLVAAWIQDYLDAITVAYSHDGGKTWGRALPKAARCTWLIAGEQPPVKDGNSFEVTNSANDPWVAIGPSASGRSVAYLTSIVTQAFPAYGASAAVVNMSYDGGVTWSDPTVLEAATMATSGAIDQTYVAADPARPGHALALWTRFDFRTPTVTSEIRMASTDDGGASWSSPRTVVRESTGRSVYFGQLALLPGGGLVLSYSDAPAVDATFLVNGSPTGEYRQLAVRSTDGGSTWSTPTVLGTTSRTVQNQGRLAQDRDGTVHVAWLDITQTPYVMRSTTSSDGGATWRPAIAVGPPLAQHDNPELASVGATGHGRLAILFYDGRNDTTPLDDVDVTDLWARTSDDGETWRETHVAGPFDRFAAPYNGLAYGDCDKELVLFSTDGCYDRSKQGDLGDLQGIAGAGSGFAMTNVLARELPGADFTVPPTDAAGHANGTDVFFMRLRR